jgi:hypothetical protein
MTLIHPKEVLEKEYGYKPEYNTYRITPEEAKKLSKMFGNTEGYWTNLQKDYDIRSNPNIPKQDTIDELRTNSEDKFAKDIWIVLCIQILLLIWSISIIAELISQEI